MVSFVKIDVGFRKMSARLCVHRGLCLRVNAHGRNSEEREPSYRKAKNYFHREIDILPITILHSSSASLPESFSALIIFDFPCASNFTAKTKAAFRSPDFWL